ncbi:hypothetical protein [Planomicrobium okeanokoites]|uniref:hypothetical protein n=1 Tax=Planomicrobium okeanokoites TaxID=244 RepID=UPI002490D2D9|nr:hypothetical protein [Planomicrobium okeanokoites]
MRKDTLELIIYTGATAASLFMLVKTYNKRQNTYWVYEDHDLRNSDDADLRESANADVDPAERGLSELDSAYRAEWVSIGYPQTHRELEANENWNN